MGLLSKGERNMILLYQHHVGQSQVPLAFHLWAIIMGIAACAGDRVWLEREPGKKLTPSMYTFLVGPSGLGKGDAMDRIVTYLELVKGGLDVFSGLITAEALMERLGTGRDPKRKGKIFVVTEELANSIGIGPQAKKFIQAMTGMYKPVGTKFSKRTVAGANADVERHNINWFAGTTQEWLIDSVPPEAFYGGFLGRVVIVNQNYDFTKKYWRKIIPKDHDSIAVHLVKRLRRLTTLEGPFRMTKRAEMLEKHWFYTRRPPKDERLIPFWMRQQDLAHKLSMVYSMADGVDQVIRSYHWNAARALAEQALREQGVVSEMCAVTRETATVQAVAEFLKREGRVREEVLVREMFHRGVNRSQTLQAITQLRYASDVYVTTLQVGKGKPFTMYDWVQNRVPAGWGRKDWVKHKKGRQA